MNRQPRPSERFSLVATVGDLEPNEFEKIFEESMRRDLRVEDADDADLDRDGFVSNGKCGFVVFEARGPVWYWADFNRYMMFLSESLAE